MNTSLRAALGCAALLLPPALAHAGRPMIVEDARILEAKACQLETWLRSNPDSREHWVIPACNFTGNLELGVGAARLRDDAGVRGSALQVQGKALFREMDKERWGLGLIAGAQRHPREAVEGRATDHYASVIASRALFDERFALHLNAGLLREGEVRSTRATWGVGGEAFASERLSFIAETFKQGAGKPQYQVGLAYQLVPNRVQLDATYGNRLGHPEGGRWVTIGLKLQSAAFLP